MFLSSVNGDKERRVNYIALEGKIDMTTFNFLNVQTEREGSEENYFQRSGLSKKVNTVPLTEIKTQESYVVKLG